MSSTEYIANLNIDQLQYLIEISENKIADIRAKSKVECFVVSDEWVNYGHYRISEPEAALKMFNKEFERRFGKDTFEGLSIKIVKYYPDEMEGLFE